MITHFDSAPRRELAAGHLQAVWTMLGDAAGCVGAGVRRIEIAAGAWSTPVHAHGVEEEIFYVLAGRALSWQDGRTAEVGAGDCIVHPASGPAHSLHALEPLDVLAFGPRIEDESPRFPRLGRVLVGGRWVEGEPGRVNRLPVQFAREAELGPPELPEPGERPANIVNVDDVEPRTLDRERVAGVFRDLGSAAGSLTTGLEHVRVPPGKHGAPLHCHSAEEEIFVILDGAGDLLLGDDEIAVTPGTVVSRPPGTGVAHALRAGARGAGLTYLAYGTREPNDICFYPRSNKISFRGVGVIGRLEPLEYWDGED